MASGASAASADTLNIALSTSSAVSGIPFTITFSGTDTPWNSGGGTPELYALVRSANGVGCQPTFGQDQQVAGTDNPSVVYNSNNNGSTVSDGNFSYPVNFTPSLGSYIVCAWLETDGNDYGGKGDVASQVVTASGSLPYSIGVPVTPGPDCVVPRYAGTTLKSVQAGLKTSHCGVGHISYARDRHVRKGRVINLSAKTGRQYKAGTKIGIEVSLG